MKACSVWYTEARLMPCRSTLSRSTSAKICGTLGSRVVKSRLNSGRLRASVRNFAVCSARKAGSLPTRSCSTKVTPPEVPTPGMEGGAKPKATASGKPASRWFSPRMITSAVSPFLSRSCQPSRVTK